MNISNSSYGVFLIISSLLVTGGVCYALYKIFRNKGRTEVQAGRISSVLGGLIGSIVIIVGIKTPTMIAVAVLIIAGVFGVLYYNSLVKLRDRIHKHDKK
ncbi:MAG: hypothetical protein ACM3MK_14405 [Chitinophagales bacterium]